MNKKTIILLGILVLKFILQYILISPWYDLQRDEYLHIDQGYHLAWGYLSVPPVTSWTSWLILQLGGSVFWVKFFPALYGTLTIFFVWKIVEKTGGSLFAHILAAISVLFSSFLRMNVLYQPNSLDILCWTLLLYCMLLYANTSQAKWLYRAAVVFAIGFLNKYSISFLVVGLLPAIFLSSQRKMITQSALYKAVGLALLLILPNLVWQYNNQFPVVHHMKELAATQLVNVNRSEFLSFQLLFNLGSLPLIAASVIALLVYKPFRPYRFMLATLIFTLAVFVYFKAKGYYAAGLYPAFIALGAVFIAERTKAGWRKYLRPVFLAVPLLLFIPMFFVVFPNKSPEYIVRHQEMYRKLGLLRWEDGKDHQLPQDFADMLGWKQLALLTDSIYARLPDPQQTIIICDNYGEAGAINYYSTTPGLVAHSFSADYINWLSLDRPLKNILLVEEPRNPGKERQAATAMFDTTFLAARRVNAFAREDTIRIYMLQGAKTELNIILKGMAEKKRRGE